MVKAELKKETMTDKLDKIFLNRIFALPLFLLVMYLVFWVAVTVGSAFIDFFDVLFGAVFVDGLALLLESIGAPDFLIALLASGVGTGIQTVATFVPVVFFMFLCLSILEDGFHHHGVPTDHHVLSGAMSLHGRRKFRENRLHR